MSHILSFSLGTFFSTGVAAVAYLGSVLCLSLLLLPKDAAPPATQPLRAEPMPSGTSPYAAAGCSTATLPTPPLPAQSPASADTACRGATFSRQHYWRRLAGGVLCGAGLLLLPLSATGSLVGCGAGLVCFFPEVRILLQYCLWPALGSGGTRCHTLLALSAFLCIPWGRFPALLPWEYTALCGLALTGLSACCRPTRTTRYEIYTELPTVLALLLALLALAQTAAQRGIPGFLLSLDTYVATPVLAHTEGAALVGMLLLGLGTFPLCPRPSLSAPQSLRHAHGPAVAAVLRRLWYAAFWLCLFSPQGISYGLGLQGVAALATDGVYFWCSVLVLAGLAAHFRGFPYLTVTRGGSLLVGYLLLRF